MSKLHAALAATAVALLAAAPSARAFDITGSWSGTYKCKGSLDGVKDSYEDTLEAGITQVGTAVGASISFTGNLFSYNGLAVANATKPDKGDLMIAICGTDDDLGAGVYDEIGRLTVTTKPSKGSGTIKGTSNYASTGPPQAYTCKWQLKRTSTVDPAVATSCP
jgi:hypothetical protein